jgi:hypothetical protein
MRSVRMSYTVSIVGMVATLGCGQQTPPDHQRVPGGVVKGVYVLRVQPSPECTAPARTFSFSVDASVADNARGTGFQILSHGVSAPVPPAARLSGASILEGELRYVSPEVHGGLGTTFVGAAATEGFQLWSHAVATGTVTNLDGGPGEVEDGLLMGELEFGRNSEDEAGLGFCNSRTHHWSLKLS